MGLGILSIQSLQTFDKSLEPGLTDLLIDRIRAVNRQSDFAGAEPPAKDSIPPVVILSFPYSSSALTPKQRIHAVASDEHGPVSRLEIWLDGKLLRQFEKAPYDLEFSTEDLKPGPHELRARAFDAAGNRAEHSVIVT